MIRNTADEDSSDGCCAAAAWPPDAEREYERVGPIGNGSYGKVWVANKKRNGCSNDENGCGDQEQEELVAIKVISTSGRNGQAYAEREVAILREMDHPNVVNLIKTYEGHRRDGRTVVAMSLACGPSLQSILDTGGALGLPLARLVSRHLIAAISYLHSRAVLHRDIKPQNLILHVPRQSHSLDWESREVMWSNDDEAGQTIREKGWKIVLVDLGFARALSKDEIESNRMLSDDVTRELKVDDPGEVGLAQSLTARVLFRSLSALGSKVYAAPEVMRARKIAERDAACLTEFSADYTFLCDEHASGKTILEVLSGAPASERDINEFIKQERLAAFFSRNREKKRWRLLHEIPNCAMSLVRDLTRPSANDRITCWVAQLYPWISGEKGEGKGERYEVPTVGSVSYRPGDVIVPLSGSALTQMEWGANANNDSDQYEQEEVPVLSIKVV